MLDNMDYETIKAKTKVAGYYDVLVNEDDEVLIAIPFKVPGEPGEPMLFYSGGEHALLMKNHRTITLCDYLNPEVRSIIAKNSKIVIVELNSEKTIDAEYEAKLVMQNGIDSIARRILEDKANG